MKTPANRIALSRQAPPSRRAFSLFTLTLCTALGGFLVVFLATTVVETLRVRRESGIRENLQTVWVAATQYFAQHDVETVSLKDLTAAAVAGEVDRVHSLKPVAGEDYQKVNEGTIQRGTTRLTLEYTYKEKTKQVTYEAPDRVLPKARSPRK